MAHSYAEQDKYNDSLKYLENVHVDQISTKHQIIYQYIQAVYHMYIGKAKEAYTTLTDILAMKEINYKRMQRWYGNSLLMYAAYEGIIKGNTTAINFIQQAKKQFVEIDNDALLAMSYNTEGMVYTALMDPELAVMSYQKSLDIYNQTNIDAKKSKVYFNLGGLHQKFCEYDQSIKYYKRAHGLATEKQELINIMGQLAIVLMYKTQFDEALLYLKETKTLCEELNDLLSLSRTYVTMGRINAEMKQFTSAHEYLSKGLEIQENISSYNYIIPTTLTYIGTTNLKEENATSANYHFHRARDYYDRNENKIGVDWVDSYLHKLDEKDVHYQNCAIFSQTSSNGIVQSIMDLFNHGMTYDISKFQSFDMQFLRDYDNLIFVSNADNNVIKYLSHISDRHIGFAFQYNPSLRSITVKHKDIEFDYGDYEKSHRKLFVLFMVINNPFGPINSKLWLILYGNKFNLERNIGEFIKHHGIVFKQMSPVDNKVCILKFDIDEHNTVQDIPILSNSFVASLMR
jgi:tetratricopeptide (TPR) repeat protein